MITHNTTLPALTPAPTDTPHVCRTCWYWESNSPQEEWVTCGLPDDPLSPVALSSSSCDEAPTFDTQFDFGCNQWQPRTEADDDD
jgi:hypothetical protein